MGEIDRRLKCSRKESGGEREGAMVKGGGGTKLRGVEGGGVVGRGKPDRRGVRLGVRSKAKEGSGVGRVWGGVRERPCAKVTALEGKGRNFGLRLQKKEDGVSGGTKNVQG